MEMNILRKPCYTVLAIAASVGTLLAFETGAMIKKVDAKKRLLQIFAGGQDRAVPVVKDAKILDEKGKPLAYGLQSKPSRKAPA
jgi:hypothetical protein